MVVSVSITFDACIRVLKVNQKCQYIKMGSHCAIGQNGSLRQARQSVRQTKRAIEEKGSGSFLFD